MHRRKAQVGPQGQDLLTERFSSWLRRTREAQQSDKGVKVSCGACTACCTSSYFIHIKPDETATLSRIPQQLLFAAPGLPKGHILLGYDQNGNCPMFVDNKCSIYEHRPQTCRSYDCRIFPATGLSEGANKPLIAQQANRWQFAFPTTQDYEHFRAVQAAAKFLQQHAEFFPPGFVPNNPTQQAVVAIKVYEVFLPFTQEFEESERTSRTHEIVAAIVAAYERFETKRNP